MFQNLVLKLVVNSHHKVVYGLAGQSNVVLELSDLLVVQPLIIIHFLTHLLQGTEVFKVLGFCLLNHLLKLEYPLLVVDLVQEHSIANLLIHALDLLPTRLHADVVYSLVPLLEFLYLIFHLGDIVYDALKGFPLGLHQIHRGIQFVPLRLDILQPSLGNIPILVRGIYRGKSFYIRFGFNYTKMLEIVHGSLHQFLGILSILPLQLGTFSEVSIRLDDLLCQSPPRNLTLGW